MREQANEIGKMIQEEMDKFETAEQVEQAVEAIKDSESSAKVKETEKSVDLSRGYAEAVRKLVGEKDFGSKLNALKQEYLAKGGDIGALKEQLAEIRQANIKLAEDFENIAKENNEPAPEVAVRLRTQDAEINSFLHSLESDASKDLAEAPVASKAGNEFLARLDAGEFGSPGDADGALGALLGELKGTPAAKEFSDEMNILMAKINKKFYPSGEKPQDGKIDMQGKDISDKEMDDMFSTLGS